VRIGSKVFAEVAVLCESEFAMGSLAPVTIWCSESLIGVLVSTADARGMVLLVADIGSAGEALPALPVALSDVVSTDANDGDAARVLVTSGGWGLPQAAETSMFNVAELGSINWLCT
jgi:hypothetical protein